MGKKKLRPRCVVCAVKNRACTIPDGEGPTYCPTTEYKDVIEKAVKEYIEPEIREFARMATIQEGECYVNRHVKPYVVQPVKTRVEEICEFADKMSYQKIGIAFCGGLHFEAHALNEIARAL